MRAADNLLETNHRPASPLGAAHQFYARACVFGGGRPSKREATLGTRT
jgi:hypothetical protein